MYSYKERFIKLGVCFYGETINPDDDELLVKEFDLGRVKGLYVVPNYVKEELQDTSQ